MFLTSTGLMPTAAPTAAPSTGITVPTIIPTTTSTPTLTPTTAPSLEPTVVVQDCTSGCSIATGPLSVFAGNTAGRLTLPTFFTFSMYMAVPELAATSSSPRRNVVDLRNDATGRSLLSVYITDTLDMQYRYNGTIIAEYGPALPLNTTVHSQVTVIVRPGGIDILTEGSPSTLSVSVPSIVDTTGQVYRVWRSNAVDVSALGTIKSLNIHSK